MSEASSAVTYTFVYIDSEPGRVFWGADEELSDGGYVAESDPEEDHEEYEEDEAEDGPVDYPMDGGDDGDGDSSGYDADKDEVDEEEENLDPADSAVVISIDELVAPPEETEPTIPPPSTDITTIRARVTIRPQTSISLPPEAEVERLLAMPTPSPSPSPLTSLSPPSTEERLARYMAPAALPSPPLPPSSYPPPPIDRRDGIPNSEQPPRKRLCLATLGSRYEVGESSTRGRGVDYGFADTVEAEMRHRGIREVGYGIRDTWIDPAEAVPEIASTNLEKDSRTLISQRVAMDSQRVDLLMGDRMTLQETVGIVEEEAYDARRDWAQLIGLNQTAHHELQTLREQVYAQEYQLQAHQAQLLLQSTLIQTQQQLHETHSQIQIMAPVTRQGQNPPPPNTNTPPHHMNPESVQAMINQALLRNSTNGDGSQSSHEDNPRHVQTTRPCFYADFMKCHPLNFNGNEGVVGLTRWIEKMESIRTLGLEAYAMTWEVLKKKMMDKYCLQGELKKLEIELWNLKVKGNNVPTYTNRFQELTLICTKFVANENEKIDNGLPDNIYENVKSSKPRMLDETIELTNDLMDQKLRTYAKSANNKRKTNDTSRNNHGHQQQPFKKQNVAKRDGKETPKGNGCFECEASGHFKRDCPKLKNKNGGNRNAQGWVYAVGNAEKNKNAQMYPDPNVVTVISCSKAQEYMAKGCQTFMAQISARKEEDKSEGKQLKDVPIIQDFSKVFPKDLPGLPPARPVEFQIDLIPGAAPVARALYQLAPSKMKELLKQLLELSDKGFIKPSSSP
uniref:Reverse transcriptase domain-containing protein n=1 Tax=Tanacetum cinerariifolium TaxID=118510 RepID=A0A6L2LU63_TANCI|nr:reverse transcriptase domain-containing protein [Tanacetum cinerariifolium]